MVQSKTFRVIMLAGVLTAAVLAVGTASATVVESLERAKAESERSDLPILVKFGSEKCGPCVEFDEAVATDPQMQRIIEENFVLCVLNGYEGEAGAIGDVYSVYQRPSFVLMNASGETMDRWNWYAGVEKFENQIQKSVPDAITVSDRFARFRTEPTEEDASKIASIRHNESLFAEAIAWYRRAKSLNPDSEENYETQIFNCYSYGTMFNIFDSADLTKQAHVVFNEPKSNDKDYMSVVYSMAKASGKLGDVALYKPFLKKGYEMTANSTHEKVMKMRESVAPDYALLIKNDAKKAVALKKNAQSEDWMKDANSLNNFAWWCFEKRVNLDEAADYAKKGIELAKPGTQKGNILDTLAEICNVTGECGESVDLMRLAVAEDPDNEYFQKQLTRFEEVLAAQK